VGGNVVEVHDGRFAACVNRTATLRRLFTGCEWSEGPVWVPAGRYLVWSDIPNDRVMRWDEPTGTVGVFRQPSRYANGATLDAQGRLVTCEHGARRVTRTEHDGSITVLADAWQGKRLNSPNDVVVRSDGSVWFSDPTYGIDSDYEGHRADSEIGASHLFRTDPATGEVVLAGGDFVKPNGLAFSLDERQLYVADTGATHVEGGPHHLRVFDVADDLSLSGGDVFAECDNGLFDGFRLDAEGRIWSSAADGVHVYDPDGTLLGKVLVPETVANVVFGGPRRTTLFIAATRSLYAIGVRVPGAPLVLDRR
jgi:gluconolactonase